MLILIFLFILIFNLAPAFTPPTWMVLSYLEITYHIHFLTLALVGATAATAGRLILAKLAKVIVRDRFLGQRAIRNLDTVRAKIEEHKKLTAGIFLFYAFSPLPSNQLFLAYGLTGLELRLIAVPFFLGRFISYLFWIVTASEIAKRLAAQFFISKKFIGSYFIIIQLSTLAVVYVFTKIDWKRLFTEKKIDWLK